MNTIQVGVVVKLKKDHPCGANKWEILEAGVYIRMKCLQCGRQTLIPRSRLERRIVSLELPRKP